MNELDDASCWLTLRQKRTRCIESNYYEADESLYSLLVTARMDDLVVELYWSRSLPYCAANRGGNKAFGSTRPYWFVQRCGERLFQFSISYTHSDKDSLLHVSTNSMDVIELLVFLHYTQRPMTFHQLQARHR